MTTFPADLRLQTDGKVWWLARDNGWACCSMTHRTPESAAQCGTTRRGRATTWRVIATPRPRRDGDAG